MTFFTSIYGGLGQGLLYALVAIGIFLTFRVMKHPDLTCEGSFAFGGALAMTLIFNGVPAILAMLVAMFGGAAAGFLTGIIHTKLKIDGIVVGLLMTMALFSINIFVMGSSSISAPMENFIFTPIRQLFSNVFGMEPFYAHLTSHIFMGLIVVGLIITGLYFLYKTSFGLSIRATGSNELMSRANGVNTDITKITALVLSNAIIALAGALIVQHQSVADVRSGAGVLVIGLAALVIGEVIMPKNANFLVKFLCITAGSIIYFVITSLIIVSGLMSADATMLLTAVITLAALCAPKLKGLYRSRRKKSGSNGNGTTGVTDTSKTEQVASANGGAE
ncbi:MAG: ABC transporter permease [Firmicutes bacterium]|nr:ABC transporter permease [Bacillota bacterium]